MASTPAAAVGWPFLVAPGRRRDYSIVVAPDFLVADLDYGILEQVVRPTADGEPATVIEVRTRHGRRLTVVSATHRLTAADIAGTVGEPRDEHGRPLRLVYGFASAQAGIREPAEADLDAAREYALTVYRRFLDHEDRVGVVASHQFPLRSRIVQPPPPAVVGMTRRLPNRRLPNRRVPNRRLPVGPSPRMVMAAILAGLALVVVLIGIWPRPPAPGAPVRPPCAGTVTPSSALSPGALSPGAVPPSCRPSVAR
jgi:hypothetical protein